MSAHKDNTTQRSGKATAPKKTTGQQSALDHALAYAGEGIPVIWIPSRSKAPKATGWPTLATTDAATIRQWATQHPSCNFGLCMGDGFIAVDVDDPGQLPELKARGFNLPQTRLHKTANGLHFIYRVPKDAVIKNAVKRLPGVDIRYKGGQIVAPGSVHPSGFVYQIDDDSPIAPLPTESLALLMEPEPPRSDVLATVGKIPIGQRNASLMKLAGAMRRRGASETAILEALRTENAARCSPPLEDVEVCGIAKSAAKYQPAFEGALADEQRPKVLLPCEDRLLSDFAAELGGHLADSFFTHGSEVITVEDGALCPISPDTFRTLVEKKVICCKLKTVPTLGSFPVGMSMGKGTAEGTLASKQFKETLRGIKRVNTCRLPVLRADGSLALLPRGYDSEAQTMTIGAVEYADDMPLEDAIRVIDDLFGEFVFAGNGARSKAVAVAALVGLYAAQIIPAGELRPCFAVTKNAEGAGATTLCAACIVPITGSVLTGAKAEGDAEMRKSITASVREGRAVIFIDNVRGLLDLPSLEAFITSPHWSDRLLGVNKSISGPNIATVFISGNGMTVTPDMRRRTLFIELHLEEEHAEDHVYKRPLSFPVLLDMSSNILAACWSLVRHWDESGRPAPKRSHSAFPKWAEIIGGIVQAAGYACPLDTAEVAAAADQDGDDMRVLVAAMKKKAGYKPEGMAALCRQEGIFPSLVGGSEADMKPANRSAFGKMLARYKERNVGSHRFLIEGKGHNRIYRVVSLQGRKVKQGVQARANFSQKMQPDSNTLSDLATLQPTPTGKPRKFTREGHATAQKKVTVAATHSAPRSEQL